MTTRYRLSNEAQTDLSNIYSYTRETFGKAQAELYVAGLMQSLTAIGAYPHIGPAVSAFRTPVRIRSYAQHVIIYVVEGEQTLVIRVLAARQHWQQVLSDIAWTSSNPKTQAENN